MTPLVLSEILTLENEHLKVGLIPTQGAKICSLMDRRTGREWLLPSQREGGGYGQVAYGGDFSQSDTSGFDECFPTVAASPHPDGSIQWPDHGELWSQPWRVEPSPDGVMTCIEGRAWPYTFSRFAHLEGEELRLEYELENRSDHAFHHLWSAHPLLKVTPGMRLILPESPSEVFVNGASDPRLGGFGDRRTWPGLLPGLDFSVIQPGTCGLAVKLFYPHPPAGPCGLLDPETGEALTFSWDRAELPHLGLWLCYGGWPDGGAGHLTVALEPCTGMPDRLLDAARLGFCRVLAPGERKTWSLRLRSHLNWNPSSRSGVTP